VANANFGACAAQAGKDVKIPASNASASPVIRKKRASARGDFGPGDAANVWK